MKALVTGAAGMLGQDLVPCLERTGYSVAGVDLEDADITDRAAVFSVFGAEKPEIVVHAAAYTDVEKAESRPDTAFRVNAAGAENVAAACAAHGARMLLISTDFVFDGKKSGPYLESDPVRPLNVYGRSKLRGEELARLQLPGLVVLRTAWLYGAGGGNFLSRILRAAGGRTSLGVVSDEVGSPTWALDLSALIVRLLSLESPGQLYHAAGGGSCSRFDLTVELFRLLGIRDVELRPVTAAGFPSPVKRPANSALDSARLAVDGLPALRPWARALAEFVNLHESSLLKIYRGRDDKEEGAP